MTQPNDDSRDSAQLPSFSRRCAIKKSAMMSGAALTGGLGTTAIVGTAAASGGCTNENEPDYDEVTYYDEWGDDQKALDVDCTDVRSPNEKDVHGMSVLYRGTTDAGGDLNHHFTVTGHTEHFEQESWGDQCNKPWTNTYGVAGHRVTIESHRNATWWDKPSGSSMAGHPTDSSGSGGPFTAREAAFTALGTAAGYVGGTWVGVAASIILAMVPESHGNESFDAYDEMMFDWDYANANGPKCGSHTVDWVVQNDDLNDESVSMDVTDEAWGEYPNYTQIQKQVDFANATKLNSVSTSSLNTTGSTPVLSTDKTLSTSEFWRESDHPEPPSEGDIIETSRGERARVTDVNVQTTLSETGAQKRSVKGKNLPNGLSTHYDDEEQMDIWANTGLVREISLSAQRLD